MILRDNHHCFACGKENPYGLHLDFTYHPDGSVSTVFTPEQRFQGYEGILHGGIITTLLDEVMAHVFIAGKVPAVTARIEVRFKKPVPIGTQLLVTGRPAGAKGRLLAAEAEITDLGGTVYSTGAGVFAPVRIEKESYVE